MIQGPAFLMSFSWYLPVHWFLFSMSLIILMWGIWSGLIRPSFHKTGSIAGRLYQQINGSEIMAFGLIGLIAPIWFWGIVFACLVVFFIYVLFLVITDTSH